MDFGEGVIFAMFGRWRTKNNSRNKSDSPEEQPVRRDAEDERPADNGEREPQVSRVRADGDTIAGSGEAVPVEAPVRPGFRPYGGDWMDEVMRDQQEKGGLDHLPGEGKPLFLSGESSMERHVNSVLKTAHYLPRWIELQQEIQADLERILHQLRAEQKSGSLLDAELGEVNRKIRQYNNACPIPMLQKGAVTADNISEQYEKWK
ncbi:hypothetical protein PAESOLCIP111_04547 [Paenibacillus solanacearum]|uniref:DnaJ homologue subfamily C member 28 conserved domain-containing protein n=1 Tax=Paenibacillus solanacearum TaxID=2048548 RepID=A0A916K4H5_9BACL|nr:DUF1992 domain-containing protein [Paenibacillus solanacearum]CAG7643755.1 hypothetical protein PAESOLCIP111_04547 [Paenibacillus solanacearum]